MTIEEALDLVLGSDKGTAYLLTVWKKKGLYNLILNGTIKDGASFYEYAPPSVLRWSYRDYRSFVRVIGKYLFRGATLEIACGRGTLLEHLVEMGITPIWGIDRSPEQIAAARKRLGSYENVTLIRARAEEYDYSTIPRMKNIIMKNFWGFLPEDVSLDLLGRLKKSLCPEGQIIIGPHIDFKKEPKVQEAYDLLRKQLGFVLDHAPTYDFGKLGFSVDKRVINDEIYYFCHHVTGFKGIDAYSRLLEEK